MKALRLKRGKLAVEEIPRAVADGEALVRVLKSGICNTDLEIARGYAGFEGTLGHEFVGVVEEASNNTTLIGKRVVGEINAGCGQCSLCLAGDPRHCRNRTVLGIHGRDGAHAEFLKLPAVNLIEVPDEVSDDEAVFVEPLAAAYGISEQIELGPGTRLAVIGDGKLGILCARSLSLLTDDLTLIGKNANKLALAAKYGNITAVMLDKAHSLEGKFDVVVEASGSESGFATALDLVRPRGKIVLKSTFSGRPRWDAAKVVVEEVTIVGSRCGRFAPALELLSNREIEVEDLISDQFSLSEGITAMARAAEKGVLKILLTM
jgi:threonine dehydrogenase-like Zn-dependent dehydrogenase